MKKINVQPVILSGGSGTRLWPMSRIGSPKQFLCIKGSESLFQGAVRRVVGLKSPEINIDPPFVVAGDDHRFLLLEQLREIESPLGMALLEPSGRNTAPALTLAALGALELKSDDPILVVVPADQTIADTEAFNFAMHAAIKEAANGSIVVLGVVPNKPETGYGYIQVNIDSHCLAYSVLNFKEKPDLETANHYLNQGSFYWNAGIFVLKASVWLSAISSFRPDIVDQTKISWCGRTSEKIDEGLFVRPNKLQFDQVPAESIDYAVLEKCTSSKFQVKMVKLDAGWSDLGVWDSVWQSLPKDQGGNAQIGDVISHNTSNSLIHSTCRLVGVVGLDNIVVVETPDAVLVANRADSQDIKTVVGELNAVGRTEHIFHRKIHRPWGWYDTIDYGERFKVKRIQVKPNASLSLQKHNYRAEHWIVVKGVAEITRGQEKIILTENQSTYIPLGELHRLSNPGSEPLEIIEVQSGSYLGEDDIVRFEDDYGRVNK